MRCKFWFQVSRYMRYLSMWARKRLAWLAYTQHLKSSSRRSSSLSEGLAMAAPYAGFKLADHKLRK